MKSKSVTILLFVLFLIAAGGQQVAAQISTYGIAYNLTVADSQIADGDIVEQTEQGIVRAAQPYSQKLFGVSTQDPVLVVHEKTSTTRSIVSGGEAHVKVSAKNGGIKSGDFITSSDIPGVGIKARNAGYVLGIAQESFKPEIAAVGANTEQGSIKVLINIHYAAAAPKDLGNPILRLITTFTSSLEDQSKVSQNIRYIIGTLLALVIFMGCLFVFSRGIKISIDAIGRNPLAKSTIQLSMMLIFGLMIVISAVGLIIAFLIIRL